MGTVKAGEDMKLDTGLAALRSARRSDAVTMPTAAPSGSTTGSAETLCLRMRSAACPAVSCLVTVITSVVMSSPTVTFTAKDPLWLGRQSCQPWRPTRRHFGR